MRFNTYFLKNFENNPEINGADPFHRKSNGFVFMSCKGSYYEWQPQKESQIP